MKKDSQYYSKIALKYMEEQIAKGEVHNNYVTYGNLNIIEDTLSQSIGIFDRNGIEIFEGDIFQHNDEYLVLFYENGEYKFKVYGWYYYIRDHKATENMFGEMRTESIQDYILDNMEVIGNIWDNKDLLENKENESIIEIAENILEEHKEAFKKLSE